MHMNHPRAVALTAGDGVRQHWDGDQFSIRDLSPPAGYHWVQRFTPEFIEAARRTRGAEPAVHRRGACPGSWQAGRRSMAGPSEAGPGTTAGLRLPGAGAVALGFPPADGSRGARLCAFAGRTCSREEDRQCHKMVVTTT
jgi:hypothetical protein